MELISNDDIIMMKNNISFIKEGFQQHNISYIKSNLVLIADQIIKNNNNFKKKYIVYRELHSYKIIKEMVQCLYLPSYKIIKVDLHTNEENIIYLRDIINKIELLVNRLYLYENDLLEIYYNIELFLDILGYNLDDEIEYYNGTKILPKFKF